MYYGAYYGRPVVVTVVVTPEAPTAIPVVETTINETTPPDHVQEAIERLLEQYKA